MTSTHSLNRKAVPELTSKVIGLLRFPLIVGVVFIHSLFSPELLPADGEASLPVYSILATLLSRMIPRVAVPMFFLFSGYLFFFRVESFTTKSYLESLRRKAVTLLVPYLLWSLLLVAFFHLLNGHMHINNADRFTTFPLNLWVATFSPDRINFPIVGQFWFLRDLMVCIVISPLLWLLITRMHHFGIILLCAAWLVGWEIPVVGYMGFSMTGLFFFTLGGWCARHKPDMIAAARRLRLFGTLWPLMIVVCALPTPEWLSLLTWQLMILTGIIFCLCLAAYLVEKRGVRPVPLLAASSFFVYAYHFSWGISPLRRLMFTIFEPASDAAYTAIYLTHTILAIIIGVELYYLLSKFFPRFTAVITGGR